MRQGKLRVLDLGSFENQWERFVHQKENAECDSLAKFLTLLEDAEELLAGVEVVKLDGNWLPEVPAFVARLPRLADLDLYRNQLADLPAFLADLKRLRVLRLRENRLRRVPDVVLKLSGLEELYLGNNPLAEIPAELSALPRLRTLSLVHTQVQEIPGPIADMPSLELDWRNAPLVRVAELEVAKTPPSVMAQGLNAWRAYRAGLDEDASASDEVKLVLVGNGQVGKTTLLENLLYPDVLTSLKRTAATPGLDVRWSVTLPRVDSQAAGRVRVNLWDFGGQGKYRQVQQLFCTPGALYVYVTTPEGAEVEDGDCYVGDDYWLSMISAFQDDDDRAPQSVLYVVSKVDQARGQVEIDEPGIQRSFPAVHKFYKVSFLRDDGIDDLREALVGHLESARQLNSKLPKKWNLIRNHLLQLREEKMPFISRQDFYDICKLHGVEDREAQKALLGDLNSSGALLHFDKGLRHHVLLDPDWIRAAVCNVLDDKPSLRRGWFTDTDMERIWKGYEEEKHDDLLALMKAFELCYEVQEEGESRYYVPALFSEEPPEDDPFENERKFGLAIHRVRCHFTPFLPAGFLAQIVVSLGKAGHDCTLHRWRTGLVLRLRGTAGSQGTLVELREDWRQRVVDVTLAGVDSMSAYRYVVRRQIENRFQELVRSKGITTLEMRDSILCPCAKCRIGDENNAYLFDVDEVLREPAHATLTCDNSPIPLAVTELRGRQDGGISSEPSAFISYNNKDRKMARQLFRLLKQRNIQPIMDEHNELGDVIDDFIERSLQKADAVVLLVSRHSLASIWVSKEIILSVEMNKRLIPYVVDPAYEDEDFQSQLIANWDQEYENLRKEEDRLCARGLPFASITRRMERNRDAYNNVDEVIRKVNSVAYLGPRSRGSLEEHVEAIVRTIHQQRAE